MSPNLTCEELEGALVAVADATAGSDEAAAVRSHTATCQDCARTLDDLRAMLAEVRTADPAPQRSERFWSQLEADTLARVRAESLPSLADARERKQKREVKRPALWLASGFAMAAAAAFAIFYVTVRVRSHGQPAAAPQAVEAPQDDTEHEDPGMLASADSDDGDTGEVVEDMAASLGDTELATLNADLDDQEPELAGLETSDSDNTAEWATSEGAPAEHMLDDMTAEQLSQVYDELSKTGSGTESGGAGG